MGHGEVIMGVQNGEGGAEKEFCPKFPPKRDINGIGTSIAWASPPHLVGRASTGHGGGAQVRLDLGRYHVSTVVIGPHEETPPFGRPRRN